MNQTWLLKRGGYYYFRVRVPAGLRQHYGKKREIKFSLGTQDPRIAKRKLLQAVSTWDERFEDVRRSGVSHLPREALRARPLEELRRANAHLSHDLTEVQSVDDAFITKFCFTLLRDALSGDAVHRANPDFGGEDYVELRGEDRKESLQVLSGMLKVGNLEAIRPTLAIYLGQQGFKVSVDSVGYQLLAFRFLETLIRELKLLDARDAGEPIDIDAIAPLDKTFRGDAGKPGVPIQALVNAWDRANTRRPKTVAEYRSVAADFEEFLESQFKVKQVMYVAKAHVLAFRDYLFARDQHFKTVEKKIGILKTLFAKAVNDDVVMANPCDRVKVDSPKVAPNPRVPFSLDDLKKIFSSEVYTQATRLKGCGEHAGFWVPLIGLYTGMRLEEICQLRVRDVKKDTEHGLFFNVNDEAGKSVKTKTSRRNVPVHRALIRIGFADFVKYASDQKYDWLFPDLKKDKYARRSSEFSKKWNRQLRVWLATEPKDRSRSFHSFRHLFKDVARSNELSEEVSDRLTGHRSAASEGRRYGGAAYPMRPLVRGMEKYRVEGLVLAHVKWKSYRSQRAYY